MADVASKHSADTADRRDDGWCVSVCVLERRFTRAILFRGERISRNN